MKHDVWSEKDLQDCLLNLPPPGGATLVRNLKSVNCWRCNLSEPCVWNEIPSSCDPCQLLDNAANTVRRHGTLDSQTQLMQLGSKDSFALINDNMDANIDSVSKLDSSVATNENSRGLESHSSDVPRRPPMTFSSTSRGQKKRWQVESFSLVLQHLIGPPSHRGANLASKGVKEETSSSQLNMTVGRSCNTTAGGSNNDEYSCRKGKGQAFDEEPLHIVDFGCGSGALLLPLASMYPNCIFTGVEMKPAALELMRRRAELAGLQNVRLFCGMIEDFRQPFHVGLALHACGNATDHVLLESVRQRSAYIVSPCCVGKLKFSMTGGSSFSSSSKLRRYTPRMPGDKPPGDSPATGDDRDVSDNRDVSVIAPEAAPQRSSDGAGVKRGMEEGGVSSDSTRGLAVLNVVSKEKGEEEEGKEDGAGVGAGGDGGDSQAREREHLRHPRSQWMRDNLKDPEAIFRRMAKIADRNHDGPPAAPVPIADGCSSSFSSSSSTPDDSSGVASLRSAAPVHPSPTQIQIHVDVASLCKLHVEADRNAAAREEGYRTGIFRVRNADLMAKGDLLVGVPNEWVQAEGGSGSGVGVGRLGKVREAIREDALFMLRNLLADA